MFMQVLAPLFCNVIIQFLVGGIYYLRPFYKVTRIHRPKIHNRYSAGFKAGSVRNYIDRKYFFTL